VENDICVYSYKLKINDARRKKPITKQLHHLKDKFKSVKEMKSKIEREIRENISSDFGYFEGRQSTKRWILDDEDVSQMYRTNSGGEIYLWCEKCNEDIEPPSKKKKDDSVSSRRQDKEAKVEIAFEELAKKHGAAYTRPQFKLWYS